MGATLYILRQQADLISSSLFRPDEVGADIVSIERATSKAPSLWREELVVGERIVAGGVREVLTYDDLVEEIFSSERVIVL
ncbi:MAG TPA: hypothetical protein VLA67_08345 [Nitrospiraceae bacterium]|nr:hypothetical protein [Nitrospiraceae bacterium]